MEKGKYVLRGKHKTGGYFYMADFHSAGMIYDAEDKSSAIVFEDKNKAEITARKMNNFYPNGPQYRVVSA